MAKLKRSLVGILCALSVFLIFPLMASSVGDWEEEIEIMGDLNMIEARDVVEVTKWTSGNVEIHFLQPIGMVNIVVAKTDGQDYLSKRCYTPIESKVVLNMTDAPGPAVYTLTIKDSSGHEASGSFEKK